MDPLPLDDELDEPDVAPDFSVFAAAGFSVAVSVFVAAGLSAFSVDPPSDVSDFSDDEPDELDDPERLSLRYQPLPLKTMPTDEKTFRRRPPHSGHSVNDGSLNAWTCSKRWSQAVQA